MLSSESSQPQQRNQILLISSLHSRTKELLGHIISNSTTDIDVRNKLHWHVSTKYYTATLAFFIHLFPPDKWEKNILDLWGGIYEQTDAVIYVFDKRQPSTFKPFTFLSKAIESLSPRPSITLCVSVPPVDTDNSAKTPATQVESYHNQCLQYGFEFIDLNSFNMQSEDHDSSCPTPLSDIKEGDIDSVTRIVEALQSHMWDGITRKYSVSSTSIEPKGCELSASLEKLDIDKAKPIENSAPASMDLGGCWQNLMNDLNDLHDIDKFDTAVTKLRSLREQAQSLPDNERRLLAEKVALGMASMFDFSDSDEE